MDRRDFLALSATSAVTLTAIPSGASAASAAGGDEEPDFTPPTDMAEYVARVDAGAARIADWRITSGQIPAHDRLAQASVQSLFLTGMLGDLPLPQQLDPQMQNRVERALPVFDEAVDGITAYIDSRTEQDLAQVAAQLRQPGFAAALIDSLDTEARRSGASRGRRKQMRAMLEHVTWRMANQPPSLLLDEYRDKVQRAQRSDLAGTTRQQELAARLGEAAFWAQDGKSPREVRAAKGAKAMGVGLAIFAVSGGLVAAGAFPAVFGMTVGAIWLLVGLIMFLSSAFLSNTPVPVADSTARRDSLPARP